MTARVHWSQKLPTVSRRQDAAHSAQAGPYPTDNESNRAKGDEDAADVHHLDADGSAGAALGDEYVEQAITTPANQAASSIRGDRKLKPAAHQPAASTRSPVAAAAATAAGVQRNASRTFAPIAIESNTDHSAAESTTESADDDAADNGPASAVTGSNLRSRARLEAVAELEERDAPSEVLGDGSDSVRIGTLPVSASAVLPPHMMMAASASGGVVVEDADVQSQSGWGTASSVGHRPALQNYLVRMFVRLS